MAINQISGCPCQGVGEQTEQERLWKERQVKEIEEVSGITVALREILYDSHHDTNQCWENFENAIKKDNQKYEAKKQELVKKNREKRFPIYYLEAKKALAGHWKQL